jgi:hypothetical protein
MRMTAMGRRMCRSLLVVAVASGLAVASQALDGPGTTNEPARTAEAAIAWGETVGGLQFGIEAISVRIEAGEPLRLNVYLRNVGSTAFRVWRGEECLHKLAAALQVTGRDGKAFKAEKGDAKASVAYRDRGDADWPSVKPGETVGPLEVLVLTSAMQATIHDVWYDWSQLDRCEAKLTYRLPLAGAPGDSPGLATATRALSPPAWTGIVVTGSTVLSR